jgi:glycosyltransferase involved in cell wall biosynthesis
VQADLRVTVVICTWNRASLLSETLERMTRLIVPPGVSWDLLIVNNNSTDETEAVATSFERRLPLRAVFEPVPGLSHARNTALRIATGDYILWTDDDVLVSEGWLMGFVEAIRAQPSASVFGGPIDIAFLTEPDPLLMDVFPMLAEGFGRLDETVHRQVRMVNGANMGFNRVAVGGYVFDRNLGRAPGSPRGGEETDFIRRIQAAGGTLVWCPDMRVTHVVDPRRMTIRYLSLFVRTAAELDARTNGVPSGPRLFGFPRWLLRQWVEAGVKAVFYQVRGRRRDALLWRRRYSELGGLMDACRSSDRTAQQRDSAVYRSVDSATAPISEPRSPNANSVTPAATASHE